MPTILSQGDIAIVQYSSDGSGDTAGETFSFVLLTDVDASTVINFTDSGFNTAGEVVTQETTLTWTSGVALPAGTVVTFTDAVANDSNNAVTTVSVGNFVSTNPFGDFATTGDQLFVYQGPIALLGDTPSLLFAAGFNDPDLNPFTAEGWNTNPSVDPNESQLPTSLIGHEIAFTFEVDNGYYSGPTSGTPEDLYAAIRDPANWTTSNDYQGVQTFTFSVVCFAAGTLIATPGGEVLVEELAIGDLVRTSDGRMVPVRWIGRQRVAVGPQTLVRIGADAISPGVPHSALTVTADHGMIIEDCVVNASALVNGVDVVWARPVETAVTVYHVETDAHDVIVANGAASETFIDYAGRQAFDNYAEYLALFGAERIFPEMGRPRITSARMVPEEVRARLGVEVATSLRDVA